MELFNNDFIGYFSSGVVIQYGKIIETTFYIDSVQRTIYFPTAFTAYACINITGVDFSDICSVREDDLYQFTIAWFDRYTEYEVVPTAHWIAIGY